MHALCALTGLAARFAIGTAAATVDSGPALPAVYRWLVAAHEGHPRLYALGSVIGLLAIGTAVGLASEALLARFGQDADAEPQAE
jgi:hypothetical protein